MHQFDQFKQDMEKLSKADLQNPIKSKQPGEIKSDRSYLDATELNRNELKPSNLFQFVESQTHQNCTVLDRPERDEARRGVRVADDADT